jgi:hypothetical protein
MRRATERRGTGGEGDAGAHSRKTDHLNTPYGLQVWSTTFNLRWAEHLKHAGHDGEHHPA